MPAVQLALDWSNLVDLSDLDTDQQIQAAIGDNCEITFTVVGAAVDVTGWSFAALIAPDVDSGPSQAWPDSAFSDKTAGGTFKLNVATADTSTLPGRSYSIQVRRVDSGNNLLIANGFWTLSPSPSFTPLPPPFGTIDWARITGTPTTLAGYGVTDVLPGSGTVTSVSVATVGGIGGTVLTPTTTPVITITGAAPLASPAFTGVPTAPTASLGTNTTQLATCAFVLANVGGGGAWGSITGTLSNQTDLQTALDAKQNLDATLTALAGQNWALNSIPVGSGTDTVSQLALTTNTFLARSSSGNAAAKPVTDFALGLLNNSTALSAQTTLGIVPGGTYAGQTLKVVRVNAAETALELATLSTGTGTVTNTGGVLTSNAVVLGATGADVKVVAGITTDGTSQINLGVNATTLGKVKLFGSTSGDVTIQPNAVAGTGIVLTLPATTGTLVTGGGTASGTNTGDQTSIVGITGTIAQFNTACTDADFVPTGAATASGLTMATARLLGRTTASSGAIEEITVGTGLSLSAGSLTCTVTSGVALGDSPTWTGAHVFTNANPITLGVNATTLGKLKLFGNTSGDATIQPAAVAGTATVVTLPNASSTLPIFGQQVTFTGPTAARTYTLPDANSTLLTSDNAASPQSICDGRISTENTISVSTSDRASQLVIYWTKHVGGNQIGLFGSGNVWRMLTFGADFAWSVTATSGKNYDLFLFHTTATPSSTDTGTDIITFASAQGWTTGAFVQVATTGGGLTAGTNYWWNAASATTGSLHTTLATALAGTSKVDLTASITSSLTGLSYEPSAAWTNDTTRADALTTQDGVLVKSGAATRRYVGTFRASGTNMTEDSVTKRFVWNFYNRVLRPLFKTDTTSSWTYTTDTWRQVRATATNQVEAVIGQSGLALIDLAALNVARNSQAGPALYCGIGEDSTSAIPANALIGTIDNPIVGGNNNIWAKYRNRPTLGYHFWAWLERAQATGTATWFGASSGAFSPGIHGTIEC